MQIAIFFLISYFLGFFLGFLKNAYSLELFTLFDNIFAPIIIILGVEFFRYTFIQANKNNKKWLVLMTVLLFLFEIFTTTKKIDFNDFALVFKTVSSSVLPILFKNLVLSYITYHVGYKPCLIYRLVMDMYPFVLPIIPDLGDYLNSMIGICMPIFLYIFSSKTIQNYYNINTKTYSHKIQLTDVVLISFIIALVALMSGYFPYYLLGIGSISMAPRINKGDVVVVHKVDDINDIQIGDVVVYEWNNKKVIHRLIDIQFQNESVSFYTKGDANNTKDDVELHFDDILGVVDFKIPLIAYPSVWVTEFLNSN